MNGELYSFYIASILWIDEHDQVEQGHHLSSFRRYAGPDIVVPNNMVRFLCRRALSIRPSMVPLARAEPVTNITAQRSNISWQSMPSWTAIPHRTARRLHDRPAKTAGCRRLEPVLATLAHGRPPRGVRIRWHGSAQKSQTSSIPAWSPPKSFRLRHASA